MTLMAYYSCIYILSAALESVSFWMANLIVKYAGTNRQCLSPRRPECSRSLQLTRKEKNKKINITLLNCIYWIYKVVNISKLELWHMLRKFSFGKSKIRGWVKRVFDASQS